MATQLYETTLLPTPVIDTSHKSIGEEINAATTTLHHDLNLLISSRIPLGLPPKSSDPSLYTLGLHAFATVYFTFEKVHARLNSSTSNDSKNPHTRPAMLEFLRNVIPDSLSRTPHLHKDIGYLTHNDNHQSPPLDVDTVVNAPLHRWVKDIYSNVPSRPHLLVAYFWTMYMAIFAGGRFIRQILADAGEEFWERVPVPTPSEGQQQYSNVAKPTTPQLESGPPFVSGRPHHQGPTRSGVEMKDQRASLTHLGYTFLSFSPPAKYDPVTGDDGASIRDDFLERLKDAEDLLTREERDDIVAEAQSVFLRLMDVVNALGQAPSGQTAESNDNGSLLTPRSQSEKELLLQKEDTWHTRTGFYRQSPAAISWRRKLAELGKFLAATIAFTVFWYLMVFMFL